VNRLTQLALRRAELIEQIGHSRSAIKTDSLGARKEIVLASLGFIITRILAKHPTLRAIAVIALAVSKKDTIFGRLGLKGLFSGGREPRE
jgi:hypothetical protein